MERGDFLTLADRLHDFILDSMEEFITGAGLPFDREVFLQETSVDLPQLTVEALFFGSDAYEVSGGSEAVAA